MSLNDINSLSHSKWNCKYHVVFAPKYRRMVFYGEKKVIVGKILRQLCEWKGVKIIQAELCPDHVHMLLEIPPKIAEYIKHQLEEDRLGEQLRMQFITGEFISICNKKVSIIILILYRLTVIILV